MHHVPWLGGTYGHPSQPCLSLAFPYQVGGPIPLLHAFKWSPISNNTTLLSLLSHTVFHTKEPNNLHPSHPTPTSFLYHPALFTSSLGVLLIRILTNDAPGLLGHLPYVPCKGHPPNCSKSWRSSSSASSFGPAGLQVDMSGWHLGAKHSSALQRWASHP